MSGIGRFTRRVVLQIDKGCCAYCGRETVMGDTPQPSTGVVVRLLASVDHRIPVSKGGSNHPSNLVNSCRPCNNLKGDMMPAEWERFCAVNPEWWNMRKPNPKASVEWLAERSVARELADWPWLRDLVMPRVREVGWGNWKTRTP